MGPLRGLWHAPPDVAAPPAWAGAEVRACLLGLLARSGLDGPAGSTIVPFRLVTAHSDPARLGRLLRESAAFEAGDPALTVVVDAVFWVPDPGDVPGTYGRGRYLVVETRRATDTVRAGSRGLLPRLHLPDRPAHLDFAALHRLADRGAGVAVDALGAITAEEVDDDDAVPWVTPPLASHGDVAGLFRTDVRDWRDAVVAHPAGLLGALLDLGHPSDDLTGAITAGYRQPGDRMLRSLRFCALAVRALAAADGLPWLVGAYVKHAAGDEQSALVGGLLAEAVGTTLEPLTRYENGLARDVVARSLAGRDRPAAPLPAPGVATRHTLSGLHRPG